MKKISRFYPKWSLGVRAQVEVLYWTLGVVGFLFLVVYVPAYVLALPHKLLEWVDERIGAFYARCYRTRELVNGRVRRSDISCSPGMEGEPSKYFLAQTGEQVEFLEE
jgi:hypothetical protein